MKFPILDEYEYIEYSISKLKNRISENLTFVQQAARCQNDQVRHYLTKCAIDRIQDSISRLDILCGIGNRHHLDQITDVDAIEVAKIAKIYNGRVRWHKYRNRDSGSVEVYTDTRSMRIYLNGSNVVVKSNGYEVREYCYRILKALRCRYQF